LQVQRRRDRTLADPGPAGLLAGRLDWSVGCSLRSGPVERGIAAR